MKISCNIFMATIIMLLATTTLLPMQPAKKMVNKAKKKVRTTLGWQNAVAQTLVGNIPAVAAVNQLTTPTPDTDISVLFGQLPKEIQNQIIFNMSQFGSTDNLIWAGRAINTLAQVNKDLNNLINSSEYCWTIIENLSDRFDCSNQEACKALQTQASKKICTMQERLYSLCVNKEDLSALSITMNFIKLRNQGVNLDFTYNGKINSGKYTPIALAIYAQNIALSAALIESGANLKAIDLEGNTPLEAAHLTQNPELITLIEDALKKSPR